MSDSAFHNAEFDTGYIDRLLPEMELDRRGADGEVDAAIAAAAILAFEESQRVQLPEERESAWRRVGRIEALR